MCQACEDRIAAVTEPEKRALLERVHEATTDLARALGDLPPGSPEAFLVAYAGLRSLSDALGATFGPKALELGLELAQRAAADRLAEIGFSAEGAH